MTPDRLPGDLGLGRDQEANNLSQRILEQLKDRYPQIDRKQPIRFVFAPTQRNIMEDGSARLYFELNNGQFPIVEHMGSLCIEAVHQTAEGKKLAAIWNMKIENAAAIFSRAFDPKEEETRNWNLVGVTN